MKQENSLLGYLKKTDATACAPLIRQLEKEGDMEIPAYFKHTFDLAPTVDSEWKENDEADEAAEREGKKPVFRVPWVLSEEKKRRYPGLSWQNVSTAYREYTASSAELVDEKNYPRLNKVFHAMCDELGFKPHGKYPNLIVAHSDVPLASASFNPFFSRQDERFMPSVFISSAYFDIMSSRMVSSRLLHELHHLVEFYRDKNHHSIPEKEKWGIRHSINKLLFPKWVERQARETEDIKMRKVIQEEYDADALALRMGISPDEIAESLLQVTQLGARQKEFCRKIKALCEETMPDKEKLPTVFLNLLRIWADEDNHLIDRGDAAMQWEKEKQYKHPSKMNRLERIMNADIPEKSPETSWVERLGKELNHGSLLDR